MKTLTHGQLFAGIGGFGLAAQWAGIDNIWANEIDPFACKVLTKNFPNTTIYEKDIRQITKETTASVDIISGGFPCQPFSQAGKRKGTDDNRYLWPEMLRVIRELQPKYVIGENVAGLLSMENGETLKTILSDLENEGYNNEVFLIPACAKGAWHRRDRLWIISYVSNTDSSRYIHRESEEQPTERGSKSSNQSTTGNTHEDVPSSSSNTENNRCGGGKDKGLPVQGREFLSREQEGGTMGSEVEGCGRESDAPYTDSRGQSGQGKLKQSISTAKDEKGEAIRSVYGCGQEQWSTQSSMGGMADGVSTWMDRYWDNEPEGVPRVAKGVKDRVHRLKGLGNAIVPQVAYELFKTIQSHYYY